MIFQHTWQWVLNGTKTQTRRLVKPGESENTAYAYPPQELGEESFPKGVFHFDPETLVRRPVYVIGQSYAVQPGRGKPAVWWRKYNGEIDYRLDADKKLVMNPRRYGRIHALSDMGYQPLRIRIVSIRNEDVRYISNLDVWAEGYTYVTRFGLPLSFWDTWVGMHDKSYLETFRKATANYSHMTIYHLVKAGFFARPVERYNAWVLTFEVVKDK